MSNAHKLGGVCVRGGAGRSRPRAPLFLRPRKSGTIIVDEEQGPATSRKRAAFTDAMSPCRAKTRNALALVALPSVARNLSRAGKEVRLLTIASRVSSSFASVESRLREDSSRRTNEPISSELHAGIRNVLPMRTQALIFINRRVFMVCPLPGCGASVQCVNAASR